jgi:hypothetical protein
MFQNTFFNFYHFTVSLISFERWLKNSSFGFFSVGLCVGKKPNVLFVRLVFALQLTFGISVVADL